MFHKYTFDGATLGVLVSNWIGWLPSSTQLANVLTVLSIVYVCAQLSTWWKGGKK